MRSGSEYIKKYSKLKNKKDDVLNDWKEIAKYVLPQLNEWSNDEVGDNNIPTQVYDGTAISAVQIMAFAMQGYFCSASIQWFNLNLEGVSEEDTPFSVKEWLQECTKHLYAVLDKSGFYDVMGQSFLNAGAIATTTMYVGERSDKQGVLFKSIHPRDYYLDESADGDIDTIYRVLNLSALRINDLFPDGNFSDELRKAINEESDQIFEILHVVQPRKNRDKSKIDNTNMKFESVYVELVKQNVIHESGYNTFPYPTWRWQKKEGSAYGVGQGHLALPEIKKVNLIAKNLLQLAEREVNPPINIPLSQRGKTRLVPKGKNYFDDNRPQARISRVDLGSNYPIGVDREEKVRQTIKEYYFVDMFVSFLRNNGQMTATEVIERQSEKASVLSNVISRLSTEFMNPIFDRLWEIEQVSGRLPEPPVEIDKFVEEGREIKIDYISPLAIAQRKSFKTQSNAEAINSIMPLMQIQPSVGDNINWDKLARDQLLATGIDISNLRSKDQVEEIRQSRAQQQQQEQLQQQKLDEADIINKVKGSKVEDKLTNG